MPSDIYLHFGNTCHKLVTVLVKQVFVMPSPLWVRCYAVLVLDCRRFRMAYRSHLEDGTDTA